MTFKDRKLNSMTFQALKTKFLHSITFQVFHDLYEPCKKVITVFIRRLLDFHAVFLMRRLFKGGVYFLIKKPKNDLLPTFSPDFT